MMKKEIGEYNDIARSFLHAKKKPPKLDRKNLILKGEQIFRQKRSDDSTVRVPKCMEDRLSPPYADSTIERMVSTAVNKLKLQKDGSEPSNCSANRKVRNAKQKEKRTPEEAEARRLRDAETTRRITMEKKMSFQVDTVIPIGPKMELLSNECLAVIVSAATKCDKLNYILHQVGNKGLLKRMNLPTLSASTMAELCKYVRMEVSFYHHQLNQTSNTLYLIYS